jgi:hypothetical protein
MGLDQYLYRKSYVRSGDYYTPAHRDVIKLIRGDKEVDTSKIRFIVEEVGYWRKANQIHKWFVDNVQDGKDDCGEYEVTEDQLRDLLETCKEVIEDRSKAEKLLPTKSGFFFGETDYDEYYFDGILNTIRIIESLFELDLNGVSYLKGDIYYSSSW